MKINFVKIRNGFFIVLAGSIIVSVMLSWAFKNKVDYASIQTAEYELKIEKKEEKIKQLKVSNIMNTCNTEKKFTELEKAVVPAFVAKAKICSKGENLNYNNYEFFYKVTGENTVDIFLVFKDMLKKSHETSSFDRTLEATCEYDESNQKWNMKNINSFVEGFYSNKEVLLCY